VRKAKQRIPPTSCQRRSRVPKQRLVGLRYSHILVDETTTNRTEALQLLDRATGDVDRLQYVCSMGGYEQEDIRKVVMDSYRVY
jgi:hypothetical protein